MKKQLDVQDLKIGMYVTDLDRPWRGTPFLFQGFEIRTQEEILELQRYCQQVTILSPELHKKIEQSKSQATVHVLDNKREQTAPRSATIALEQELLKINNHPNARSSYDDLTTLEEEMQLAGEVYHEARGLILNAIEDTKFGRNLNVAGVKQTTTKMAESVIRNPDALTCFAQLKNKNEYVVLHSLRVCVYALIFGRQLGLAQGELKTLGIGALLHDIGKARIPDEILNKPDRLSDTEYKIIKRHIPWGLEILQKTNAIPEAALEVVRSHHERYDGSGYVDGLKGETIGTFGLIGGIVDYYDAITSDKPHRRAISPYVALKKMYELRNKWFHPRLAEKYIQCIGIYPIGSVVKLNTGEIGVVVGLNRMARLKPRVVLVRQADNSPYPMKPAVNLVIRKTPDGRSCEIDSVLDPATCGVDPTQYLPFQTTV